MCRAGPERTPLAADLVNLYDRFVEFHDYCAFYCDAVACLAADTDGMDPDTVMGMQRQSQWLKHRVHRLKQDLKHVQERSSHAVPKNQRPHEQT